MKINACLNIHNICFINMIHNLYQAFSYGRYIVPELKIPARQVTHTPAHRVFHVAKCIVCEACLDDKDIQTGHSTRYAASQNHTKTILKQY